MTYLALANWDRYQDIRVDDPFYVKLHICILDDKKVQLLPMIPRLLWYELLPLAGRYRNAIPLNVTAIAKETRIERHSVAKALEMLLSRGLVRETQTPYRPGSRLPPRTGWMLTRGSHSSTFVRHPDGRDRPPAAFLKSLRKATK